MKKLLSFMLTVLMSFGITYRSAGENIEKGQKSPQEVMTAWMNPSGHRVNILNRNYNGIGIGFYNGAWVPSFEKFFFST